MAHNVFTISMMAFVANLLLAIIIGVTSISDIQTLQETGTLDTALNSVTATGDQILSKAPNQTMACLPDDPTCQDSIRGTGVIENVVQDAITYVLNIGGAITQVIKFIGLVAFAPLTLNSQIQPYISGVVPKFLIGFTLVMWNLLSLYYILGFILNRRGQ